MNKIKLEQIRNIAIIAHVDAGKTTLTERMLLVTGVIHKAGEVHDGNTTMDYMKQERDRGITITAAATQMKRGDIFINLIDTPGHKDFAAEVINCLRVLEGAVIVIDGSAGVESQTESVWRRATAYKVSRVFFINKMDKVGASLEDSLNSIRDILTPNIFCCHHPIFLNEKFIGFYDLVNLTKVMYNSDSNIDMVVTSYSDLTEFEQSDILRRRKTLTESLGNVNDEIAEHVLNEQDVSIEDMRRCIRETVVACKGYAVFVGSAFKYKGVDQILDAVCDYLPSPLDREFTPALSVVDNSDISVPITEDCTLAFIFKVITDRYLGQIYFVRVYNGSISEGSVLYCSNKFTKIKVSGIYRFCANEKQRLQILHSGDIAALATDKLQTGDTLVSQDRKNIVLASMIKIPHVFEVAIVPKTKDDNDKFNRFINQILDEDSSVSVVYNKEQNEILMRGVGSLHLEVSIEKLRELGVDVEVSKPKVSYRETIRKSVTIKHVHKKQTGGRGQFAEIHMIVGPCEEEFKFEDIVTRGVIPKDYMPEIMKGCIEALEHGIISNSKVINVSIKIIDGSTHKVDSTAQIFNLASKNAVKEALKQADSVLLEPIMTVQVITPEEFLNKVTSTITSRQGEIYNITKTIMDGKNYSVIESLVPLANMFDYANVVREMSKGKADYNMSLSQYRACSKIPSNNI